MSALLRAATLWVARRGLVRRTVTESGLGRRVASRFVAGSGLEDAMAAAEGLRGRGIGAILDHLGENVTSAAQASAAADAYILALKRVREVPHLDAAVSVKLTQLGLDVSTELCAEHLERVLQAAGDQERPTLVMIDMESSEYVGRTLDLYVRLRARYPHVGVCLQSYLFRTLDDARRIGGPGAFVRMCKGAYLEPPHVAFRSRRDVRANFARLVATLLAAGSVVHVATHDPRLIEGAKAFARRRRVPRERYEFQMLYGVRRDIQAALVAEGEPVRVYVPYGTQWYPYLTRRVAERPANVWFFLSQLVRRGG